MSPEKSLMDDLALGHQRKRCNHSSTFNGLNNDHYSRVLNSLAKYEKNTTKYYLCIKYCMGIRPPI